MRNLVFNLQIISIKNKVGQWVSLCCSLEVEWVIVMSVLHLNSMIGRYIIVYEKLLGISRDGLSKYYSTSLSIYFHEMFFDISSYKNNLFYY